MIKFYIGKVDTVEYDTFNIKFMIDQDKNMKFYATPVVVPNRYPKTNDEVFVIQPDSNFEIFLYFLTPVNYDEDSTDNTLSFKYGNAKIELSKNSENEDKYTITIDTDNDSNIVMSEKSINITCGQSSIEMSDKEVNINGHLKVSK